MKKLSKLSKRAILTIIVIATFLTVMIPIVPVMAITDPIYVVDADTVDSFYVLETVGTGTAAWTNADKHSGIQSVELIDGGVVTNAARVLFPINVDFDDIDDLSYWFKYNDGSLDQAFPYMILSIDTNDNGVIDKVVVLEHAGELYAPVKDIWNKWDLDVFDEWHSPGTAGDSYTLEELQALIDGTVLAVKVAVGESGSVGVTAYIDDIEINGVLLPLEQKGTQKGKEPTVSGTGVQSGAVVEIFWDLVTSANVLGTTMAANDGSFEYEFDVISDYGGYHYIWARDVGGVAKRAVNPIFVVPKISFSPSSGLPGDEITITGYGFSSEAEVTITFPTHTNTYKLSLDTGIDNTNELGYFEYIFEIQSGILQEIDYTVTAIDEHGYSVTGTFEVGASVKVTPDSGPSGKIIEVNGEGFATGAVTTITVELIGDDVPSRGCTVIDSAGLVVDIHEEITFEIVIPSVDKDDMEDYEKIEVTIDTGTPKTVSTAFEVTGTTVITIDPAFGVQGSTVSIEGYNFTAITDKVVELVLIPDGGGTPITVDDFETDSDGAFSEHFIVPAVQSGLYDLIARQVTYGITTSEDFNVGIMIVILNPSYGPSGTKIYLTGTGFTTGEEWNATFGDIEILPTEDTGPVGVGTVSDDFFVPSVDVGTYTVTVTDIDRDINVKVNFNVIATTALDLDPAAAPNGYNVTLEGSYFTALAGTTLDFVLYNATEDWDPIDMDVWQGGFTGDDPPIGDEKAVTDGDGNFTAWWYVPDDETLSIGDYMINVTNTNSINKQELFAQIAFSVAEERVDVAPRKELFAIGDTVSFDVNNDFIYDDAYLKIWDPNENLYWVTDPIDKDYWTKDQDLYSVPYYKQTSGENPMMLSPDAPLETWTWAFYTTDNDELVNGTFAVGRSSADILTEKIEALSEELGMDIDTIRTVIDDLGIDMDDAVSSMAEQIATAVSSMEDDLDDAVTGMQDDISGLSDDMDDMGTKMDSIETMVDDISGTSSAAQQAANDAKNAADQSLEAAEATQRQTSGLQGLVYGAIGASLIAALAAIVSLMQISRRIAG